MKWLQYSNEDLSKDEIVFGERKYIMNVINIEVGNARGCVEAKWAPGCNSVIQIYYINLYASKLPITYLYIILLEGHFL